MKLLAQLAYAIFWRTSKAIVLTVIYTGNAIDWVVKRFK